MSEFQKQFVVSVDTRNRWHWFLYDEGMKPIASAYGSYRSYEECVESTRQAIGIAQDAAIWDAELQRWDDRVPVRA